MDYPTHKEELMLLALASGERYGLQIQKAVEKCSAGQQKLEMGDVYPGLDKMEKAGLVVSRREGNAISGKRYYSLTDAGRKAIRDLQTFRSKLAQWKPSPDDKDGARGVLDSLFTL